MKGEFQRIGFSLRVRTATPIRGHLIGVGRSPMRG